MTRTLIIGTYPTCPTELIAALAHLGPIQFLWPQDEGRLRFDVRHVLDKFKPTLLVYVDTFPCGMRWLRKTGSSFSVVIFQSRRRPFAFTNRRWMELIQRPLPVTTLIICHEEATAVTSLLTQRKHQTPYKEGTVYHPNVTSQSTVLIWSKDEPLLQPEAWSRWLTFIRQYACIHRTHNNNNNNNTK
jgi:hypothetical protein